jgi:hypothetical protein
MASRAGSPGRSWTAAVGIWYAGQTFWGNCMRRWIALFTLALLVLPAAAEPVEDTGDAASETPRFQEGDTITLSQIDKLKPFLPEPFWDNRHFLFYEGMKLRDAWLVRMDLKNDDHPYHHKDIWIDKETGNRIEFWDAHGTPPPSRDEIRRFIDVGRLTKGH